MIRLLRCLLPTAAAAVVIAGQQLMAAADEIKPLDDESFVINLKTTFPPTGCRAPKCGPGDDGGRSSFRTPIRR